MEKINTKYVGITYPKIFRNKISRFLWKKYLCPKNMHLFDECMSMEHYLVCDCCGFSVHIACTQTEKEACEMAEELTYVETSYIIKSERHLLKINEGEIPGYSHAAGHYE